MKTYGISEITHKRVLGRTNLAYKGGEVLPLFWAASALEVNVRSSEVWATFSADYDTSEPWVSVFVNGSPLSRFAVIKGGPQVVCLVRGLNPGKENLITIYKDTQPMTGEARHSLFVHSVALADDGEFCAVRPRAMNIEFIGDSITSGEGLAGGEQEMDWITPWFSGSRTYAAQAARALDADFSVLSQCGWGLCWGWDGNRKNRLPPYYGQVCGVAWGEYQKSLGAQESFDFSRGADVVVVNLGTNDNGAFHQPPFNQAQDGDTYRLTDENGSAKKESAAEIVRAAKEFIGAIREKNPSAEIVWVWGMIRLDIVPALLRQAVTEYASETGDRKVHALELDAMEDAERLPEDKGSRGHPGPTTHKLAADKLVRLITGLFER